MSFHEVRFPTAISFGSTGGVERRTEIISLVNGFEQRNTPWEHSRRRYDAGLGVQSLDDLEAVLSFWVMRSNFPTPKSRLWTVSDVCPRIVGWPMWYSRTCRSLDLETAFRS
jgi:hypothetical protein